ncbi:MAG: nucleoside hydrolase [Rhodospirillaceae bacterium]|jgi:purine nucleosidase|nr:nucleoside hydrolase [Rhodospirillaceae bacterium]MBT3494199.1 nucleoside hydrolase [Rhodospirillaceae bacterium]MBT3781517.1 nucleoside hydrolase [Rhodospirillaceae bacterium]MBT3979260.1 nucleoside hydrolase [Rhodospirillaceae bacterium]MBT4170109.1 nucleoside hydrolase [Rhodospirillaceae bacterium]
MARIPIIIDCDPGVDDALALLLALASPDELEVLGVTAVGGNVALAKTQYNAQRILALAGREEVPVHAGSASPMLIDLHTTDVHGSDGIGGAALPEPTAPLASVNGVTYLNESLAARPGEITLCCLGPLTNPGLAICNQKNVLGDARRVVLMGGSSERGNVTAYAEFNFFVDPHAARLVFLSGADLVMLGLNLTRQVPITAARVAQIAAVGTRAAKAAQQMLTVYGRGDTAMHDPCVIAYLLQPELFSGHQALVDIEINDAERIGQSVVGDPTEIGITNALVLDKIDADGFFDLLCERLARLP